jgi:hypothetical protein
MPAWSVAMRADGLAAKQSPIETVKMNWIGWIFVAALIMIAFEIYSDASMTRCVPGSFVAIVGVCSQDHK